MTDVLRAFRLTVRRLGRTPSFSAIVVLTLALGIGASTLVYSVIDGVLLKPLPYPDPDRIVRVTQLDERGNHANPSDPNFADLQEQTRSLAAFAQFTTYDVPVVGGNEAVRTSVADVSRDFFAAIGVEPMLGRRFLAEEQMPGARPAAIVSYAFWQRSLGGTPDYASRTLRFSDREFTIVGVMPPGFDYPGGVDVWSPRELWPIGGRTAHNYRALGRLAPDVTLETAQADFSGVARRLKAQYGDDTFMADAELVTLREQLVGSARPALLMLGAAAILLFIAACANVASLMLARAVARDHELATRLALGAGRARLAGDFLLEALALCVPGAVVGIVLALWGTAALRILGAGRLPRAADLGLDWKGAAFAMALALLAAGALSVLAAWRVPADADTLRSSKRAIAANASSRLREGLVAAQLAIALVLLVGVSLLGRSFARAMDVDPGFRPEGAVLMNVTLPFPRDRAAEDRVRAFQRQVLERLGGLSGVQSVGGITVLPLAGDNTNGRYVVQDRPDEIRDFGQLKALINDRSRTGFAEFRVASEGYFATLGIPLLRGRVFAPSDDEAAPHVAVVSRALADSQWPGQDPLGKLVQFGGMDGDLSPFTVIGVVGDVHDYGLENAPRPTFYAYYLQRPRHADSFWIAIRAADPQSVIPAAREIVRGIAPDVPPQFMMSAQLYERALSDRRFNLATLAVLGGVALLVALAGVYGAIAFSVAQRTHEIGVRVALGARARSVVALILRRSLAWVATGIAAGVVIAIGASRLIGSLLYGVSQRDPLAYMAAAVVLLVMSVLAAWVPARRASRIDPMEALREE